MSLADAPISLAREAFEPAITPAESASAPSDAAACHCLDAMMDDRWDRPFAMRQFARDGLVAIPATLATITQAARILGERWVADTASFGDVTLGMHRLTLLLIDLEDMPDPAREKLHGGRVLLAAASDDQHSFGLAMVAFELRRAGWDVTVELSGDADAIVERASRGFDCIGLSVGHDRAVSPSARLVQRLRRASASRRTVIAVGGPMLLRDHDLAVTVGADVAAVDGSALVRSIAGLCPAHV